MRLLTFAIAALSLVACGGEGGGPPSPMGGSAGGTGGSVSPVGSSGDSGSGPAPGPAAPASAALFDEGRVVTFALTFPPGEWERLISTTAVNADQRWVPCSFSFEGEAFPRAACRRKGNMRHWPSEKKPQLVVRFNLWDAKGRFRGMRRLNLESFHQTEAPIRDRLGMWMMKQAGVPASRVNHARVLKDGQLLGLYMNVESIDREFLESTFGRADADGNLWESGEVGLELKTNESVNDRTRLTALQALIDSEPLEGDHTAFFSRLPMLVDVDQVLQELAAETVALTDDNFSNGGANYLLYEHPRRGFVVLPWDLDTIFWAVDDADPFAFWDGAPPNKLRQLMNANPIWRADFVGRVVKLRDQLLPMLPARVTAICDQIRSAVREDPNRNSSFAAFEEDCQNMTERPLQRQRALMRMLGR